MHENNKSRKHRYNKRKCLRADKLQALERNINTSDSIKVTIMNNINKNEPDTIVDENDNGTSHDDGDGEADSFLLKVVFNNNKMYSDLKMTVFNSIKQGLNGKHLIMKENDDKNLIEIFENADGHLQIDTEANKIELSDDLFTIDTEPEVLTKNAKKSKVIEVPVYTTNKFTSVLTDSTKTKNDAPNKGRSGGMSCFNCGENHNLKDCQKPRNHAKIQQRISKIRGGERYHIEPNQKYANVVPGKLSKEIRDALGLRKNDIPSHVYRMRIFGYPPGWLEDHKISNSGLTLFDSDGKTVVGDSDEEQGEIVEKEQYDLNKIIEFPGFNVPPTKQNQYDDFHRNRVPPMAEHHSKEAMICFLSDKLVTPYKRKKLLNFPGANMKSDDNNIEEQCMEIEDDDDYSSPILPPLPDEDMSKSNPPPPPPPDNSISIDSEESGELISDDEEGPSKIMETPTNLNSIPVSDDLPTESNSAVPPNETISSDETSEMNLCTTKFESNGTPLLQFSPYTSLPSGDKFSVGVSDVINFENLPDSTGKYETMKEILKRVRNQMEKLHDEL